MRTAEELSVARRSAPSGSLRPLVVWLAWIVAGAAGSGVAVLVTQAMWDNQVGASQLGTDWFGFFTVLFSEVCLAAAQFAVLRALVGRRSLTIAAWFPVSVVAAVVAALGIDVWQSTVPRALISVSAIQSSLPPDFPLVQVIQAFFGLTGAAVIGLAQGSLLARWIEPRVLWLWLLANLLAAITVGFVQGIRTPLTGGSDTLTFELNAIADGVHYAAVAGLALVVATTRKSRFPANTVVESG
jgi:hypothetical protein